MELSVKIKPGIIESLAYRFSDTNFKRFIQSEYNHAIAESLRDISKKYHINSRFVTGTITEDDLDSETEIQLNISDADMFRFESRVEVNGVALDKVNEFSAITSLTTSKEYILKEFNGSIYFNYYPKTIDDIYSIKYNVVEGADGVVEIPSKYREELLDLAMIKLARVGLIKYPDEVSQRVYMNLIRMQNESDNTRKIIPDNAVDEQWIEIKPYLPV